MAKDVAEEPINLEAISKSGYRLVVEKWMLDPCCVCGRELAATQGRYCDWIAKTVKCERCYNQPIIDALWAGKNARYDGDERG